MAISADKKRMIVEARAMGLPVKLIAELAGVSESSARRHWGLCGDQRLLSTTIEVMERLAKDHPVEWLKRSVNRREFTSVDRLRVDLAVDNSGEMFADFLDRLEKDLSEDEPGETA